LPEAVAVNVTEVPVQTFLLIGSSVMTGDCCTVKEAVDAKLSTVASALPAPEVEPAVKVAVVVPFACMVDCAPLKVLPAGRALVNVTGTPTSLSMLADTLVPAELFVKLAVSRVEPQTVTDPGVCVSLRYGVKAAVPLMTAEGVLVPHQLLVMLLIVPPTYLNALLTAFELAVLLAMRL
jgi:hypothetical protein